MDNSEIFAAGSGVPGWANSGLWFTLPLDKWPKLELKVYICCKKCEEIADEKIREVAGIVAVKIDRLASKVTVTGYLDPSNVLKKVRKVDKKAIILSYVNPQKEKPNEKKEDHATTSSFVYEPSQYYPPRHYPYYPETDYSQFLFAYPHYLKHVTYQKCWLLFLFLHSEMHI